MPSRDPRGLCSSHRAHGTRAVPPRWYGLGGILDDGRGGPGSWGDRIKRAGRVARHGREDVIELSARCSARPRPRLRLGLHPRPGGGEENSCTRIGSRLCVLYATSQIGLSLVVDGASDDVLCAPALGPHPAAWSARV